MREYIETVKAKNPGLCFRCGQPIYVGDAITTQNEQGMPVAYHLQCKVEEINS